MKASKSPEFQPLPCHPSGGANDGGDHVRGDGDASGVGASFARHRRRFRPRAQENRRTKGGDNDATRAAGGSKR